jgi:hypothetical protein
MGSRLRLGLVAATLLAGAVASPAVATASSGWSRPLRLAGHPQSGAQPTARIVTNARGDVALAWADRAGIRVAVKRAGKRFQGPALIPGSRSAQFDEERTFLVGISGAGDVVVAWSFNDHTRRAGPPQTGEGDCCLRIRAAIKRAGRPFGGVRTLSHAGSSAYAPDLAVSRGGAAMVVWTQDDLVKASAASRHRAFGEPRTIAGVGYAGGATAKVAFTTRGRAIVDWWVTTYKTTTPGYALTRILSRSRSADGRWSRRSTLAAISGAPSILGLASDASGGQAVVWSITAGLEIHLVVARRAPNRDFGAPVILSRSIEAANFLGQPVTLSLGADGTTLVAWRNFTFFGGPVFGAIARPGGGFHRPFTLNRVKFETDPPPAPGAAAALRGSGFVAWRRAGGPGAPILAAVARGGRFGPARRVPVLARTQPLFAPAIAALPHGRAVVAVPGPGLVGVSFYSP